MGMRIGDMRVLGELEETKTKSSRGWNVFLIKTK